MYNWITLLYAWNNIVNQLYFKKNFFNKISAFRNGRNLEFWSPHFHTKLKFSRSLNEYPLLTAIPASPYCLTLNLFHLTQKKNNICFIVLLQRSNKITDMKYFITYKLLWKCKTVLSDWSRNVESTQFYHICESCFQLDYVIEFQASLYNHICLGLAHLYTLIKVNIKKEKKFNLYLCLIQRPIAITSFKCS